MLPTPITFFKELLFLIIFNKRFCMLMILNQSVFNHLLGIIFPALFLCPFKQAFYQFFLIHIQ